MSGGVRCEISPLPCPGRRGGSLTESGKRKASRPTSQDAGCQAQTASRLTRTILSGGPGPDYTLSASPPSFFRHLQMAKPQRA